MATLSDFSQGFLAAAILLYIGAFIYAMNYDWVKVSELKSKNDELDQHWRETNEGKKGGAYSSKDVEIIVRSVMEKREHGRSLFRKLINSGKTGVFLGGLSGAITGGPAGALATGVVFGLINPIVVGLNEILHVPEELDASLASKEKDEVRKKLGYFSHLPPY